MIKFKILDTSTGLYSHGGYTPNWTERGKSWDTIGSVTSHLKLYLRGYSRNAKWHSTGKKIPKSWVVVEFKVTLTEVNRTPINDLIGEPRALPETVHVSGKDKCRTKNSKKQKSKSGKKIGKRSDD